MKNKSEGDGQMYLVEGNRNRCRDFCRRLIGESYFDFYMPYVSDGAGTHFGEISRFLWESKKECARFKNSYSGPAVVDVTEWADGQSNTYFRAFVCFMKDREDSVPCVFTSEREFSGSILECINSVFETERVNLTEEMEKERVNRRTIGFTADDEKEAC